MKLQETAAVVSFFKVEKKFEKFHLKNFEKKLEKTCNPLISFEKTRSVFFFFFMKNFRSKRTFFSN